MRNIKFDLPGGREDHYLFITPDDFIPLFDKYEQHMNSWGDISWTGCTKRELRERLQIGDESLVKQSDDYLESIEDQVLMSPGWRNVDDVVGAVPNVPAFLAGHPQCMRRRQRTMRESSPLAIFMDLSSSAAVATRQVQRRGVVLLALVRMLVEHRPVELWVGTAGGHPSKLNMSETVAWRIDTAPLDLARSAFHIGATAMSRGFSYGLETAVFGSTGQWPFGSFSEHRETAKERLERAFEGQQLLYVPPIFRTDPLITDPVGWITNVLAEYTGEKKEEDE